jgi:hypothetical protein
LPGTCFGYADRVRIGFGAKRSDLEEGLRRLDAFM